jgi:hypothetical protein
MTAARSLAPVLSLAIVVLGCSPHDSAHAVSCESVIGKWDWFTQGVVIFNADGSLIHEPGNDGTWQCTDANPGAVTIQWRQGGFVNHMALSPDGSMLSSTDPSQAYVSGRRMDAGVAGAPANSDPVEPTATALVLETQTVDGQTLARNLPDLMKRATAKAQTWRPDAVPVALEYQYLDPPNPRLKGPQVKLSFLSPSDGTGQIITVTPTGASTFTFNQRVTWGSLSLLPAFVDLPNAARIAVANGANAPINGASLRIWSPGKAPPVLAWMMGNKTLEGTTGEIIDFDVTGYIASYNAQWEHAARGLRALLRASRGRPAGGGVEIGGGDGGSYTSSDSSDDGSAARAEHERNAAQSRAYWGLSTEDYNRIQGGDCTWSDSSNGHC